MPVLSRRKYDRASLKPVGDALAGRRNQSESALHPSGLITALATPFDEAGALDLDAWRRLLQWQLAAGVEGVVVAGSTGEAAMLEDAEYELLLRVAGYTLEKLYGDYDLNEYGEDSERMIFVART